MSSIRVQISQTGLARIEAEASRVVAKVTDEIAEDARRLAPVDTGALRSSIAAVPSEGRVEARSDHAVYVELGTRHMRAQPYLRPAAYRKRAVR